MSVREKKRPAARRAGGKGCHDASDLKVRLLVLLPNFNDLFGKPDATTCARQTSSCKRRYDADIHRLKNQKSSIGRIYGSVTLIEKIHRIKSTIAKQACFSTGDSMKSYRGEIRLGQKDLGGSDPERHRTGEAQSLCGDRKNHLAKQG